MPNLGFGEILLILILALIIFGPRKLPEMGRSIGRGLREFRRAASDIRAEIEDDVEEPPAARPPASRRRSAGPSPTTGTEADPKPTTGEPPAD